MTSLDRMLRAGLWAIAAFSAAYLLQIGLQTAGLVYSPVARGFSLGGAPAGIQMRYFGDVLLACVAFALAFVAGLALPLRRAPDRVLVASTLGLVALDVAFFFSRVLAVS